MTRKQLGVAALTAYAAAIYGANALTAHYGMQPIAPGLTATAGTIAAGLALLFRDAVQDTLGRAWVVAGIAIGALLTLAASPALALASATAFLVAEIADMAVYTPLREHGWARAAFWSGVAGGIVDTAAFLSLAPFPFEWAAFFGQLVGKLAWATALPILAVIAYRQVRRAVPRHTLGT